jgi:streptogramin lyase
VSMWAADSSLDEGPIVGTIVDGAYYFDEVNCIKCVLQFSFRGAKTSRIGVSLSGTENFSLTRHDVTKAALVEGASVLGSPFNAPETLVEGPSKSIWVLDRLGNRVALIAAGRTPREIELPSPFADAGDIVATSRFVWISERRVRRIVRFALDGSYKEYQLVTAGGFYESLRMVPASDDRIWFTNEGELGTLDPGLEKPKYVLAPQPSFIDAVAVGKDGRIWVTGSASPQLTGPFIAAISMDGRWERFPLAHTVTEIVPATDGVWVRGGDYSDYLAFVSWKGRETTIQSPVEQMWPRLFVAGANDVIWLSDRYGNMIGHAMLDGSVRLEYTNFGPAGISDMRFDAAGNLWVAEPKAHIIEEYRKAVFLPPPGVSPKNLLFDSSGSLWYSDPDADVVGVFAKTGRSRCYAFRLSRVKSCAFREASIIGRLSATARSKNLADGTRVELHGISQAVRHDL